MAESSRLRDLPTLATAAPGPAQRSPASANLEDEKTRPLTASEAAALGREAVGGRPAPSIARLLNKA